MADDRVDDPRIAQEPSRYANAKERRLRFAAFYVGEAAGNGALTARLAGYSPNGAHSQATKLLQHPEVVALLTQLRAEQAASRIATRQQQEEWLTEMASGKATEPIVTMSGEIVDRPIRIRERQHAIDQLAKRHGHYAEDAARSKGLTLLEEIASVGAALAKTRK